MDLVSTCVSELLRRKDGQLDLHTDGCLDLYIGGEPKGQTTKVNEA